MSLHVNKTLLTCRILDWLLRKPSSAGEGSLFCLGDTDVKLSCPEAGIALPRLVLLSKLPATAVALLPVAESTPIRCSKPYSCATPRLLNSKACTDQLAQLMHC